MNRRKPAFNMVWHIIFMEILKIYLKNRHLIKYYVIKRFNIVKNPKCDGYMRECTSMVYKLFDEKSTVAYAFFSRKKSLCVHQIK